jgi:hypothetical protein
VKYQIDGLHLKSRTEKGRKPLLTRLKLSSQMTHHVTPFLVLVLVPGAEYLFSQDKPVDLVSKIQKSPSDLSSMILNYAFIITVSAANVDESSEKAMETYLAKYPESYYSLQLRYLFYKYYRESGQTKKGGDLAKEEKGRGSIDGLNPNDLHPGSFPLDDRGNPGDQTPPPTGMMIPSTSGTSSKISRPIVP